MAQGFAFDELRRSGGFDVAREPPDQRIGGFMRHVWSCPEHLQDLPEALAAEPADALVVDFVMHGALAAAERAAIPTVSFVHSAIAGVVAPPGSAMANARVAATNALRAAAGLGAIERTTDAWDRFPMLVTTLRELDTAAAGAPATAYYVGPITEQFESREWQSPWDRGDGRPLVVVSFTTTGFWDQHGRIERTLAALASEPVRILVCGEKGGASGLGVPPNAAIRGFIPHAAVLPSASVVVTHCGHGTVAASLTHGVPLVGLPNKGADQPYLAQRVEQLGAGIALDGDAEPDLIGAAVRKVLDDPRYATAARALGESILASPGVTGAVAFVEGVARAT
ncbi:MAG TPA: nucleotide disphospho-sugar-binding domain-containing protein [Polyangiaceae bacterium]|nr:nucleotide disphospho-sugar-binding domain-containing protein [Polyangiaceae bacterium]